MSESTVGDILQPDAKAVMATNNVMAHLWRLILYRVRPGFNRWEINLIEHIEVINVGVSETKRRNDKSNLSKSLSKDTMSWPTLVEGILVLNFNTVKIRFTTSINNVEREFSIDLRTRVEAAQSDKLFDRADVIAASVAITELWPRILEAHTSPTDTWEEKLAEYSTTQAIKENDLNPTELITAAAIRSGLRKKLKRKVITWDAFLQGITSLGIEYLTIKVELEAIKSVHVALRVKLK